MNNMIKQKLSFNDLSKTVQLDSIICSLKEISHLLSLNDVDIKIRKTFKEPIDISLLFFYIQAGCILHYLVYFYSVQKLFRFM